MIPDNDFLSLAFAILLGLIGMAIFRRGNSLFSNHIEPSAEGPGRTNAKIVNRAHTNVVRFQAKDRQE